MPLGPIPVPGDVDPRFHGTPSSPRKAQVTPKK
jgi:hypothetical protein